jgi:hypothetical protein
MRVTRPKDGDWASVRRAIQQLSAELAPTSSPTFASLTLSNLTASKLVGTDANKAMQSISVGTSLSLSGTTLNTIQGIRTTDSPTFAGLTVGALSGVLKATTGVVAGSAAHSELASIGANDHHSQAHAIDGADHTATGLTAGYVMTATGATTFAFQEAAGNIVQVANETARLARSSISDNGDIVYQLDTGNYYYYREL